MSANSSLHKLALIMPKTPKTQFTHTKQDKFHHNIAGSSRGDRGRLQKCLITDQVPLQCDDPLDTIPSLKYEPCDSIKSECVPCDDSQGDGDQIPPIAALGDNQSILYSEEGSVVKTESQELDINSQSHFLAGSSEVTDNSNIKVKSEDALSQQDNQESHNLLPHQIVTPLKDTTGGVITASTKFTFVKIWR